MAPSAPLPLPPPSPLNAYLEGEGAARPSNGHSTAPDIIAPTLITAQPKLPGKSNLKRHSRFGGPQQPQQLSQSSMRHFPTITSNSLVDNGAIDPKMMMEQDFSEARAPSMSGSGNVADVVASDADYISYTSKDSRVTWTDSQGKDLAEVWEFEPSDTGDSDEESDGDSSQSCTCAIQ